MEYLQQSTTFPSFMINESRLHEFIRVGWIPLPESIVPPKRSFFLWEKLPEPLENANPSSFMDELASSIQALRLGSEERIGVMVSGGIDSGTLLYFLSKVYGSEHLIAYTVDFGYAPEEIVQASLLCEERQVKHQVLKMGLAEHFSLLEETVQNLRSPTDFATQMLLISKRCVEDGVNVLVSGLGLDELCGGYKEHVQATDKTFPEVEAQLLWRSQSHYAWVQKANASSVQVQFPFLDKNLIAYCRGLPRSFKCVGSETKLLLRAAMRKHLPSGIIEAGRTVGTKRGFTPLIEDWWMQGLGEWVSHELKRVPLKYKLQPCMLESEMKRFLGGKSLYWRQLRLASLPTFLRLFSS